MTTIEHVIPADPARVWRALTRGGWLGDDAVLDPRPGGQGSVRDDHLLRHVVVEVADADRRLVYRWWPLTPGGVGEASRVTVDLLEDAAGTRVVVSEAPLAAGTPLPPAGPLALATG